MRKDIFKVIDHTLLRQDITAAELASHCAEAREFGFCSVVVQPLHVGTAAKLLEGSGVIAGTVVGFPFGEEHSEVKSYQARLAESLGAGEVDMVMAVSLAKQGKWEEVAADIRAVTSAVSVPVKVIIETSLLTAEEIKLACEACISGGAAFVKTSTGYFGQGATAENVALMKSVCGERIRIKAAGGVRSLADIEAMLNAGADRIGTSAGAKIARGGEAAGGY